MGRQHVALRRNWSFGRKSAGAVEVSLDEQADRVGGARRVLVCSSGQPERAISRPLGPQGPALGSPFWSVSRQAIYRVKSLIQRVHKAEFSRARAAMQEIADWLTRLGLPEYPGAFAENGIDVSVLPHLTDQDLKDIGVLLGHRRKILAAVAELPGRLRSASKPFPPLVEAGDRHTAESPQPAPVAPPPTEAMGERGMSR